MTTKLNFEAPPDLSVGTVTIRGEGGELVREWIATPNNRKADDIQAQPGYYIAEIAPAGVRPQSIIFEVLPGEANTVIAPVFSSLSATGSEPTFLNVADQNQAVQALAKSGRIVEQSVEPSKLLTTSLYEQNVLKTMTVSLAVEKTGGSNVWTAFEGRPAFDLAGSELQGLILGAAPNRRLRLAVAVQGTKLERMMLPAYRHGTQIAVIAAQFSAPDVTIKVVPADPERRALFRALEAGTRDEAIAVRNGVLQSGMRRFLEGQDADPFAAVLCGLLMLRFPSDFGQIDSKWMKTLMALAPFVYDTHIIHARSILTNASKDMDARHFAAVKALSSLRKSMALERPHFCFANQLAGEMLTALASWKDLDEKLKKSASSLLKKWRSGVPSHGGSGATFTWLDDGIDETGKLTRRDGEQVFRGKVGFGRILAFAGLSAKRQSERRAVSKRVQSDTIDQFASELTPPALRRPAGPDADPNKGRFGGKAEDQGFRLEVLFRRETENKRRVALTITVFADKDVPPGTTAAFCLHPTFHPQWVGTIFRKRRATISIVAWGGFTVGAWLPKQGIELECDLSLLPDAPESIRDV